MPRLPTSVVRDEHPYTRSETPWIIGESSGVYGKLIHYLSGGGMSTFGRTVKQEEARSRRRRFFAVSAAIGVLWLALLVF